MPIRKTTGLSVSFTASWRDFKNLINPTNFQRRYRQAISQATATNGSIVLSELRRNITDGHYARSRTPNAPLTVFIKGGRTPLVDEGDLPKMFSLSIVDYRSFEVGVRDQANAKWIEKIHDGAKIPVTHQMRTMFEMLSRASMGQDVQLWGRALELWRRRPGGWLPLNDSTTHIRIPARPFFREVVNNNALRRLLGENWNAAASRAVAGLPVNYSTFRRP